MVDAGRGARHDGAVGRMGRPRALLGCIADSGADVYYNAYAYTDPDIDDSAVAGGAPVRRLCRHMEYEHL